MSTSKSAYRYEEIAASLRGCIARGAYAAAGKLPSEHDLAEQFGVNRLTLRRAVDLLEAEGLVTRHRGRGTFIGEQREPVSKHHAYVYVGLVGAHFWSEVYEALGAALQDHGHRIAAYRPAGGGEPDAAFGAWLQTFSKEPAIICQLDCWGPVGPIVEALNLPAVVINLPVKPEKVPVPQVVSDSLRAAQVATEHLVAKGHRKIAFLGFGSDPAPGKGYFVPFASNLGLAGYRQAMHEARLPVEERVIGTYGGGASLQAELRAFIDYLGEWPTAFVCQQDFKARDLYQVAAEAGLRLPEDLSVVSLGNTPWAEALVPALTSVGTSPEAMAALALHVLHLPAETAAALYRLEPRLVERESVQSIAMESSS